MPETGGARIIPNYICKKNLALGHVKEYGIREINICASKAFQATLVKIKTPLQHIRSNAKKH